MLTFSSAAMKLGKHAPKLDTRTLRLAKYVPSIPRPPSSIDWGGHVPAWGMMKNDAIGDCTCAAAGHMIEAWTSIASSAVVVSDTSVLRAYEAVSGYDPKSGANDNGAVELDVLNYWRKTGIGGHKISAFAAFSGAEDLRLSTWIFGGAYLGLALPLSAQRQTIWDVPAGGTHGAGAPGSWGGHAVNVVAYDAHSITIVTWGQRMLMTWRFFAAYCDEAYGVLSADWIARGHAPSGFDVAVLRADLAAL